MVCPDCGVEVADGQKFCHECGVALTDRSPDVATQDVSTDDVSTEGVEAVEGVEDDAEAETESHVEASVPTDVPGPPDTEPVDTMAPPPTEQLPDTEPVDTMAPPPPEQLPDTEPVDTMAPPPPEQLPDTEPVDTMAPPRPDELVDTRPVEPVATPADEPTVPVEVADNEYLPPAAAGALVQHEHTDATPDHPAPATTTAEMPTLFDGSADLVEYAEPREPFRVRVVFILALFTTAAVLMSIVADVIDIRTTRPAAGIATGTRTLEDLGTNLGLAAFAAAAVMVLGALLACFGHRWGAGLAGGSGLALLGWAGLTIGLAELPIAVAESITRTSPERFTLRVTRDLGWWLVASVGVLGVLVFFASLRSIGTGARRALNPLIAAVTALATVILGFGPLVPVGDATFSDNFRSGDPSRDLPTAFFAGRLGQVALIAAVGAVGMLLVRAYGLGLTAGAVTAATVLWITSLVELGDRPAGIADRNPGATTTVPHAVTTVGMVGTLALLAIATVLAIVRLHRTA